MSTEKQLRLLVCDPDPGAREMIREFLHGSPIKVQFTSAAEPLERTLAKNSPFNAVVMDLSNPSKRACDTLVSTVKRVAPGAEVIFLSRFADEMLWSQVLNLGAYDLLPNPPERGEFLRTVFGAVQNRQAA